MEGLRLSPKPAPSVRLSPELFAKSGAVSRTFEGPMGGCQGPSWNTQTYGEGGVDGDDGGGGASGIVTVWTFDTARMVTTVQAGATSPNAVSEYA